MDLNLMTWPEVDARLEKGACVMLPTGSTEQHGPMGLIGTDTINVESTVADPVREFLRISEVNYHPHDPTTAEISAGFTDDDDFEFWIVENVPRRAIEYFDLKYKSGMFHPHAFRHEIELPDDMIPEAWRDRDDMNR